MRRGFVLLLPCLFLSVMPLLAEDVTTIINRSVAANESDWKAAPQYACFVKERNDNGVKTYEELMIAGSPYDRVVAINGKPLSASEQAQEEQKMRKVIDERRRESRDARDRRISKYEEERKRDQMMMSELTKAFTFTLIGKQKLDGHTVYALKAMPRPGYQPPTMETKVLPGMQGRLWVDANDYQWVKVMAETVRPVSITGFLARVEPGTRFELEKAPVEGGVWLPKHFAMRAHAKILYFINHKTQEDDTYFDCHKQSSLDKEEQLAANFHEPHAGE
jgi:hypothetical protein